MHRIKDPLIFEVTKAKDYLVYGLGKKIGIINEIHDDLYEVTFYCDFDKRILDENDYIYLTEKEIAGCFTSPSKILIKTNNELGLFD